jgi:hypothetical protein
MRAGGRPPKLAVVPPIGKDGSVNQTELFLAIVGLIVVEIYHLKWIWWEHWMCRSCGTANKNCSCGPPPKWFKYL